MQELVQLSLTGICMTFIVKERICEIKKLPVGMTLVYTPEGKLAGRIGIKIYKLTNEQTAAMLCYLSIPKQ